MRNLTKSTHLNQVINVVLFVFLITILDSCSNENNKKPLEPITFRTNTPTIKVISTPSSQQAVFNNAAATTNVLKNRNISVDMSDLQALNEYANKSDWDSNDKIGVFAVRAKTVLATENILSDVNNTRFTNKGAGIFNSLKSVYYPEDNTKLDFVAYYPYVENINEFNYPIDISEQKDVLYSNNLKGLNGSNHSSNALKFKRVLTKLILNVTSKTAGGSLSGLKVMLKGAKTKANLSLVSGKLTIDNSSVRNIDLPVVGTNSKKTIVAYVLPTTASDNIELVFNVGGKVYTWNVAETIAVGKMYSYNVALDKLPVVVQHTKYMEIPLYTAGGIAPNAIKVTHMVGSISWLSSSDAPANLRNYSISYDTKNLIPYWVAYPMHPIYLRSGNRTNKWAYDPKVPTDKQAKLKKGYANGYAVNRGHMMASSDRNASRSLNATTFYYTNMAPQYSKMNGGKWNELEQKVQAWCKETKYDTLYVVTGNILPEKVANYTYTSDNNGKQIPIPKYCYKALLHKNKATGEYKSIAFKMDNTPTPPHYTQCVMSVAELEKETGFTFFSNLPDNVEQVVKQNKSISEWNK